MSEIARASRNFQWRPALLAVMCLGFGAYCLYDGLHAYPLQQQQHEQWLAFKDQNVNWQQTWPAYAAENNLPTNPNEITERSDSDILTQFIMAAIVLPVGLVGAFRFADSFRWWVKADEQGLTTHNGRNARWEDITRLDKALWDRKGIAWVYFKDPKGAERRILLDDWKYDREPTDRILKMVEARRPELTDTPAKPERTDSTTEAASV